ncbi:MAG: ribosomal protein S18-alanine N-acetyltransferase [Clostridiales bacterium]|nr:ribosomal protein S18-alanine N-acetyltransferase [Clostridiales bacterium]
MKEVNIRKMSWEDVPQVAILEKQCFSMPWSEESLRDSLQLGYSIFLVAEMPDLEMEENVFDIPSDGKKQDNKSKIVGYIGMYRGMDEGDITNIAVFSEFRRQGIGAKLITEMIDCGKQLSITKINLEVRISNSNAVYLYEKLGFEKCGVRKNFYQKPLEDAIVMCKNI